MYSNLISVIHILNMIRYFWHILVEFISNRKFSKDKVLIFKKMIISQYIQYSFFKFNKKIFINQNSTLVYNNFRFGWLFIEFFK